VHGTTCAGSHGGRTRTRCARRSWTWPLKDRTAASRCSRCYGRCRVDRTRSGLRHDDAAWRRTCGHNRGRRCCLDRDHWRGGRFGHWSRRGGRLCGRRYYRSRCYRCRSCCRCDRCRRRRWGRDHRFCCDRDSRGRDDHRTFNRRLRGHRRSRNDGTDRRPAGDRRRWHNDIGLLTRQGNDAPGCGRTGLNCLSRRRTGDDNSRRNCSDCSRRSHSGRRGRNNGRRRRRSGHNNRGARRWSIPGVSFGLLALEDRLQGVAGLRDFGEIELRLVVGGRSVRTRIATSGLEVVAHPYGLIGVDRAGVRERLVLGHANCSQRV
jgi:hypothetical protein